MVDLRPCETLIEDFCCMVYIVSTLSKIHQKLKPMEILILAIEKPWNWLSICRIERLVSPIVYMITMQQIDPQSP